MTLDGCYSCSSAPINLMDTPFPFGTNQHITAYVNVDGVISFTSDFTYQPPSLFPGVPTDPTHLSFAVAPFWANLDSRLQGQVRYKTFEAGENSASDELLTRVSNFVSNQTDSVGFSGSWMLVVTWDRLQEFKRVDNPTLSSSTNTFQAITISNGTKSYAIFTYQCNTIQWYGAATIGFNAAGTFFENHPYSGTVNTDYIDCIHSPESNWTNLIYDLVPDPSTLTGDTPSLPPYGSCLQSGLNSGFSGCCDLDGPMQCAGYSPADCFCDRACVMFGDCCGDVGQLCPLPDSANDTFLLVSGSQTIEFFNPRDQSVRVTYNGSINTVPSNIVASDYSSLYAYFFDAGSNLLRRVRLDGSNPVDLLTTGTDVVGGLAVDWVGSNLYWTDSRNMRIQVLDLDSVQRATLIKTGADSVPSAIAVDPGTSYMIWINGGTTPTIERASLDGSDRQILHSTGLVQPSGLTMDYAAQKIYWADSSRGVIESSYFDGSGRRQLISLLGRDAGVNPFSITLDRRVLYWSDWTSNVVYATSKEAVNDLRRSVMGVYVSGRNVSSIVSISPYRQRRVENPCDGNNCSHLCLLSATTDVGYSCACPDGSTLMNDSLNCMIVPTSSSVLSSPTSTINAAPSTTTTLSLVSTITTTTTTTTTTTMQISSITQIVSSSRLIPTSTSAVAGPASTTTSQPTSTVGSVTVPSSTPAPVQVSTSTTQVVSTSSTTKSQPSTSSVKPVQVTTSQEQILPSSTSTPPSTISSAVIPISSSATSSSTKVVPTATPTSSATTPTLGVTTPTEPSPPGKPTNLQVSVINDTSLLATWTGVPGVTIYFILVSGYNAGTATTVFMNYTDQVYSQVLSGTIEPYIAYSVSVTASNGMFGDPTISPYIFTRQGVPLSGPELQTPFRNSSGIIIVYWKELPLDRARGFVTNYTISYEREKATELQTSDPKDGGIKVVNSTTYEVVLDNLDIKSTYTVVVWANTTVGRGKSSRQLTVYPSEGVTHPSSSHGGAIAGGVLAVLVLVAVAAAMMIGLLCFLRRRNKVKNMSYDIFDEDADDSSPENHEDDDDKAMILATSFKGKAEKMAVIAANPLATFDNPVYALTGGAGLPQNGVDDSGQEADMEKEDLAMIGKPLYEDDIEL